MDLNIRGLSDLLSEKLPHDQDKLKLSDIESSGIPFLVRKRIAQITQDKFIRSLGELSSEWADLQSSGAVDAWDGYLKQMTEHLEIPAEKAGELIYEAVEFTLKLAVQPRKTIIKELFKDSETITKEDVDRQMDQFVSNRHLVFALSRYMDKKKKESLGIDEARKIIKRVDEKLADSYNSLDWMEAVKPVFNVAGALVPSDYIRIFFEEKEMPRVARKYDLLDRDISETDFVEVMSSADLLDMSGFEEEQPALFTQDEAMPDSGEQDEAVEVDPIAEDNAEMDSVDEQHTKSSLSDIFTSGDDVNEQEEGSADNFNEYPDDSTPGNDRQDPYLFELFREDEESVPDTDELDEDLIQEEADEEMVSSAEEDIGIEESFSEMEFKETEPEDVDLEEPVDSEEEAPALSDFERGKFEGEEESEAEDLSDEEEADSEEVTPRDEELFPDEDESIGDRNEDDYEEEIEDGSLLDQFMDIDDADEETEDEERSSRTASIYDELNLSQVDGDETDNNRVFSEDFEPEFEDDEFEEEEPEDLYPFEPNDRAVEQSDDPADSDELPTEEESGIPEDEQNEEVPMWKSFLEREDPDDEPSFYFDESSEVSKDEETGFYSEEDETDEYPVINIGDSVDGLTGDEIEQLSKWLSADRDRFIRTIFNDSSLAWEQALIDLTIFDDWKSAAKYLEKEIFNKNRIDIYSEVAVDFTDYLHSYFMEYKS